MKKKYIWLGVGVIALAGYLLYKSSGKKKSFTNINPEWATEKDRIGVPINLINR
jgi:hypothetical protein